jgi:hypothetical protein
MKTQEHFKWVLISWIFIFISAPAFSQTIIKGKVIDSKTEKPIPYVSIYFPEINSGSISNTEGCFRFTNNESSPGQLVVRGIGYESQIFDFEKGVPSVIKLEKASLIRDPLAIKKLEPDHDPVYIFYKAVKDAKKNRVKRSSRSYLSIETVSGKGVPVEVLEAYYQSDYTIKNGLSDMALKNGRFGMMDQNGQFFSSLQATKALTNYELFLHARKSYFANSPFALTKSQGQERFIFNLKSIIKDTDELIAEIEFIPREEHKDLISGVAYISLDNLQLRQIKMHVSGSGKILFTPVSSQTPKEDISLDIVLNYKKDSKGEIIYDYILFDYTYDYTKPQEVQRMTSEALLVFYDYDHPFIMPLCKADKINSDHEKIMAAPYNHYFWDRNSVFETTAAKRDHTDYLLDNGIVVNYENDCLQSVTLDNPIKSWDPNSPITWDDFLIKDARDLEIDTPLITWSDNSLKPESDVNLDFHIFLDCNMDGDSLYFCCRTVFNRKTSYYLKEKDSIALEYINLQFDMVESVRRKMAESLCKKSFKLENAEDINLIYKDYMGRLNKMMHAMTRDVNEGNDLIKLTEWRTKVSAELNKATAQLSPR